VLELEFEEVDRRAQQHQRLNGREVAVAEDVPEDDLDP
jgi:hypothetical protein